MKQGSSVIVTWEGFTEAQRPPATAMVTEVLDTDTVRLLFDHELDEEYQFERAADSVHWYEINNSGEAVSIVEANRADEDEGYCVVNTEEEFEKWCNEGGWKGAEGFTDSTGVSFEEQQGQAFLVVHNRVFLEFEGPSRGIA